MSALRVGLRPSAQALDSGSVATVEDTDKLVVNLFTDPKTSHEIDCWAKARKT